MAPKRVNAARKRRGAQKWILATLRELGSTEKLSTSKIAKRIQKASGKAFHKNSVYNALRILVNQGAIKAIRDGHEKSYQVAGSSGPARPAKAAPSVRTVTRTPLPRVTPIAEPEVVDVSNPASALPHKLALGEILVLKVGESHVHTATNLHGRLVLEKHRLGAATEGGQ